VCGSIVVICNVADTACRPIVCIYLHILNFILQCKGGLNERRVTLNRVKAML